MCVCVCVSGHQLIVLAGNESCLACAATIAAPVCLGAGVLCVYLRTCVCARTRVCVDATVCSASPAFSRLPHCSQETSIIVVFVCVCVCVCVFAWGNRI